QGQRQRVEAARAGDGDERFDTVNEQVAEPEPARAGRGQLAQPVVVGAGSGERPRRGSGHTLLPSRNWKAWGWAPWPWMYRRSCDAGPRSKPAGVSSR